MAGKIPQNFIDDLIDKTDIVELIDSRVKLKKTGRNYSACCPFHEEKTPSFSVNPDKQFYYCFGCGAGGNAVSFIMDYDRSDFVETIETLAAHNGVQVPRETNPLAEKQHKAKKSIYDLLEQSSQFYQQQLRSHSNKALAVDYLKQRGLSGEIAHHFQIGFAPDGWDNLLKHLGDSDEQKKLLLDGGMLIEKDKGGFYDRFRERLMFPIRDSRGRTIAFGGRVFNDDKPKYLNSPETPVFQKQQELYGLYEARQANRHLQRLVMVEGYMDVVALAQFGINYAVATLGTAAGSQHMEKVFRQCNEVIFCFDGDEAGRKAATRALDAVIPLMQAGRQAKFLFLPQGEDPDSHVRRIGQDAFEMQLDDAMGLSEYVFQVAATDLDLQKMDDRASFVNKAIPFIQSMPTGTFQELMLRGLSEKSGLPIEDIRRLEITDKKDTSSPVKTHSTAPENPWYEERWNHAEDHQASWTDEDDHSWHEGLNDDFNKQKSYNHSDQNPYAHNNKQPKQRVKIPPSQRKVKRTPLRTAIAQLLFEPSLLEFIPDDLQFDDSPESVLLQRIIDHIKNQDEPQTGAVIGYWLGQEKDNITPYLSLEHHFENNEAQTAEFQQCLNKIQQQQLQQQMQHLKTALENETDHEKAKKLALHYLEVAKLEKSCHLN